MKELTTVIVGILVGAAFVGFAGLCLYQGIEAIVAPVVCVAP